MENLHVDYLEELKSIVESVSNLVNKDALAVVKKGKGVDEISENLAFLKGNFKSFETLMFKEFNRLLKNNDSKKTRNSLSIKANRDVRKNPGISLDEKKKLDRAYKKLVEKKTLISNEKHALEEQVKSAKGTTKELYLSLLKDERKIKSMFADLQVIKLAGPQTLAKPCLDFKEIKLYQDMAQRELLFHIVTGDGDFVCILESNLNHLSNADNSCRVHSVAFFSYIYKEALKDCSPFDFKHTPHNLEAPYSYGTENYHVMNFRSDIEAVISQVRRMFMDMVLNKEGVVSLPKPTPVAYLYKQYAEIVTEICAKQEFKQVILHANEDYCTENIKDRGGIYDFANDNFKFVELMCYFYDMTKFRDKSEKHSEQAKEEKTSNQSQYSSPLVEIFDIDPIRSVLIDRLSIAENTPLKPQITALKGLLQSIDRDQVLNTVDTGVKEVLKIKESFFDRFKKNTSDH